MSSNFDVSHWHPICSSSDLPLRHVYHGQLLGREMAVWRADDGFVNVWENRCLHRGVRLSIGLNEGQELRCLYHGWRYANRTAGCTYIPAHPADAPARTICNHTYQCVESHGLVWTSVEADGALEVPDSLQNGDPFVLRPIPVNASAQLVLEDALAYYFSPIGEEGATCSVEAQNTNCVVLKSTQDGQSATLCLFVQPVDSARSVLRGVLSEHPLEPLKLLRHHNSLMAKLRDGIEQRAANLPAPEPIQVDFAKVDDELAKMPDLKKTGPKAQIRVRVAHKEMIAKGLAAFKLEALEGQLPTFQPGAHIDVHLPNGLIRQYSLTNGPGQLDHYAIGVSLEANSRGGSKTLHEDVREGDVLAISLPRNNFPLRRDATKTHFLGWGSGITPLLAMARTLQAQDLNFALHYFVPAQEYAGFEEILASFGDKVTLHLGLDRHQAKEAIKEILKQPESSQHLYVCGSPEMLEGTIEIATQQKWPDEAIHFEYFKNTRQIKDQSSFEVALARSGITLQVPAGKTILAVLQENDIEIPSSCEQGACGTCLATLIEGEGDHQDVYLSPSEKSANQSIITCVSRAKSKRLVLDI